MAQSTRTLVNEITSAGFTAVAEVLSSDESENEEEYRYHRHFAIYN